MEYIFKNLKRIQFLKKIKLFVLSMWKLTPGYGTKEKLSYVVRKEKRSKATTSFNLNP
jgi:hypothetical protein